MTDTVYYNAEAADLAQEDISFSFGGNSKKFLERVDEDKLAEAERSLGEFNRIPRFDSYDFPDVGSGSGLSSYPARRPQRYLSGYGSQRGMDFYRDVDDWICRPPCEFAGPAETVDFAATGDCNCCDYRQSTDVAATSFCFRNWLARSRPVIAQRLSVDVSTTFRKLGPGPESAPGRC